MKKLIAAALTLALLFTLLPSAVSAASYPDVPADSWALADITGARDAGIMSGNADGTFGYGTSLRRSEFVAMLVRLMGWTKEQPTASSFSDVPADSWYLADVETALKHGAIQNTGTFRPEKEITREEMATMLVGALGYADLAQYTAAYGNPFTDVSQTDGAITMAYDFGIIYGTTPTQFQPKGLAKREEAAAMIMRLYRKLHQETNFKTGFYAVAAASQMNYIPDFSSICFGWSRLEYDGAVKLNTTSDNGNSWFTPSGYDSALNKAKDNSVQAILTVYMDVYQKYQDANGQEQQVASAILLDADAREAAVQQLVAGMNDKGYDGLCLDFEGFKGETLKQGFTQFVTLLSSQLKAQGKLLYVTVPPALYNQPYFDGYDYHALGALCDKVILMAYDYEATSLNETYMNMGYTTTPLTPFESVYYSLRVFTDAQTGVPAEKAVLGLAMDSAQWKLKDGKVQNSTPYRPYYSAIYERLQQSGTVIQYHARYRNPFATFTNAEDGTENVVWYEDERSLEEKIQLGKLFDMNGLSVWRLGLIPDYQDGSEYYLDVWNKVLK